MNLDLLKLTWPKVTAIALLLSTLPFGIFAETVELPIPEETNDREQKEAELLAAPSDATSIKLLNNNVTVTGAKSIVEKSHYSSEIRAKGTFTYGKDSKDYELIERSGGERALIIKWTYMGQSYTEKIVSVPSNFREGTEETPNLWRIITKTVPDKNGRTTEERVYLQLLRGKEILQEEEFGHTVVSYGAQLRRKELTYEQWQVISGGYGERSPIHFQTVPFFLHDFYHHEITGCRYIGMDKVGGRQTYVIQRGSDSFYYIDKEKFLLLKWGREEYFAGKKIEVSYIANAFKRWGTSPEQILLPSKITISVKRQTLGSFTVDHAEARSHMSDNPVFKIPEI
ncbi:MAG: hypothetical protein ACNA77_10595 [Opitutales bacterium]